MKTHINCAHAKLFIVKGLQLTEMVQLNHTWQVIKKRAYNYEQCNHFFFGASNSYKQHNELKTWCCIYVKVTRLFQLVRTFGYKG